MKYKGRNEGGPNGRGILLPHVRCLPKEMKNNADWMVRVVYDCFYKCEISNGSFCFHSEI